jgi:uncharacterized membrane protein YfcA
LDFLSLIAVGLASGALLASTGVIGPFLVPVLLLLGFPSDMARGTTFISELLMTLLSATIYGRRGKLDKRVVIAFLPGAATVILGAKLPQIFEFSEQSMKMSIGIFEIIIGLAMTITVYMTMRKSASQRSSGNIATDGRTMAKLMGIAVFAGLIKGFFGAGWSPIGIGLFVIMGVDLSITVGSSLAIRLLLDVTGGITFASMNLVNIDAAVILTLAGCIAIVPAAKLAIQASKEKLRSFLGIAIILLGMFVMAEALAG